MYNSKRGDWIMLSLTGDFRSSLLPVHYACRDRICTHILLHDDARSDRRFARRLADGMRRLARLEGQSLDIAEEELDEDAPQSIDHIERRLEKLCEGDFSRVLFNATDGLASLSLPLSCRLLARGATVLAYDRYDNTLTSLLPDGTTRRETLPGMGIAEHLILQDYEILEHSTMEDLKPRKAALYQLGGDLARYKEYADTLARLRDPDAIHGFDDIKEALQGTGRHRDLKYVQGTLFEEFIALILDQTGWFDEVWTGVKVAVDEELENEYDVLMIRDNHLHTIECKLVRRLDGERFVYKMETVMDYLDEDGRGMILSIGAPNERRDRRGRIR
ncbi:DUF1887 family CARF protein, partial [Nitratifractor sp.]|uniref:Card1-like endonuclease domain-containing protein n=1 Tax=Nitratifractor sp. TaxID=2268144 RepID=UPI0025F1F60B